MTKLVEWHDGLSVGIDEIDEQHQVLVGLLNEMHDAIEHRKGNEVVGEVLEQLRDYTRIHFAVEESLMRVLGYPGLAVHKQKHQELLVQLNELREKFNSGKTAIGFELMHFLRIWLTSHIMECDQAYVNHFRETGHADRIARRSLVSRILGGVR